MFRSQLDDMSCRLGFSKPVDILTAILYLRYGNVFGENALDAFYKNFKTYDSLNEEHLVKVSNFIANKNIESMIDYKNDHANVFFNYGRLILLSLTHSLSRTLIKQEATTPLNIDFNALLGSLNGVLSVYGDLAGNLLNNVNGEFDKDGICDTISPVLVVKPYSDADFTALNHSEILPIIATALQYSMIGFIFNNFSDDVLKSTFKFKEDVGYETFDGKELIQIVISSLNKTTASDSFFKCASIYNTIVSYIERSIGKTFNDRFSLAFKAIGSTYNLAFDLRFDITDDNQYDLIIDSELNMYDTCIVLIKEVTRPKSVVYIGDHTYDLRGMYLRQIFDNNTEYSSCLNTIISHFGFNEDFSNLRNYTSVIDAHAYDRAIKFAISEYRIVSTTEDQTEYIRSFYRLKYLEKLISDAFKCWSTNSAPRKIEGVDDLYVEETLQSGRTIKVIKNVSSVKYSIAYARVMTIITQLNARYCEAYELYYATQGSSDKTELVSKYKRTDSVIPVIDIKFDSITDCIRAYTSGKLPYIATLGSAGDRVINRYLEDNSDEIDIAKIQKIGIFDKSYEGKQSIFKTPFEVMESDSFAYTLIENTGFSDKIAPIFRNLSNAEIVYISR